MMTAHVKPTLDHYDDLEGPICDMARKALATSIISQRLIELMRKAAKIKQGASVEGFLILAENEISLLLAYIDDLAGESDAIRDKYYGAHDAAQAARSKP